MVELPANEALREEFNRWAEAGRGEDMEREHRRITEQTLALMNFQLTDNILDVGCGAGWLARMLAPLVPQGRIVGMDVSDEMVRRARRNCTDIDHAVFVVGEVEEIPWEPNYFSKAITVESAYYWPAPERGLREIFRILSEGSSAWILINYYRDNPYCHQWGPLLAVPTHLFSADEWSGTFRDVGFQEVEHQRIIDDTPVPPVYTGKWFRDADELRRFRQEGALLVHGSKPRL